MAYLARTETKGNKSQRVIEIVTETAEQIVSEVNQLITNNTLVHGMGYSIWRMTSINDRIGKTLVKEGTI